MTIFVMSWMLGNASNRACGRGRGGLFQYAEPNQVPSRCNSCAVSCPGAGNKAGEVTLLTTASSDLRLTQTARLPAIGEGLVGRIAI